MYDDVAGHVRRLLPFEQLSIALADLAQGTHTRVYNAGRPVQGGMSVGTTKRISSAAATSALYQRRSRLLTTEAEMPLTWPGGIRSTLVVPLIAHDTVIGTLVVRSRNPEQYSQQDLALAERVAAQIAGAIANAQAYAELQQAEGALREREHEAAPLAAIGRIISSTLDIDEVYELFAAEVRQLIPYDHMAIGTVDLDQDTITNAYNTGRELTPDWAIGKRHPLRGVATESVVRARQAQLMQAETDEELVVQFPATRGALSRGMRSTISVPLVARDTVVGALTLRAAEADAYTQRHLALAEQVGMQIAGAINNAWAYAELQQAEGALREREHEAATLAAIGRIISSTLDIDEVYEQVAAQVWKLIPFDTMLVAVADIEQGMYTTAYGAGLELQESSVGYTSTIADAVDRAVLYERQSQLLLGEARQPLAWSAGIRSSVVVPLVAQDAVVGALVLRSHKPQAYAKRHVAVAERVGAQIAGAIANAQAHEALQEAQAALQVSQDRYRALFDQAPIGITVSMKPTAPQSASQRVTMNKRYVEIVGRRADELQHQNGTSFTHPEDRAIQQHLTDELFAGQRERFQIEKRYVHEDGSVTWAHLHAAIVRSSIIEPAMVLTMVEDITARKEAEERARLAQAEVLQAQASADAALEADRLKSDFVATVSHELRTPLSALLGFSELLVQRQLSPKHVKEYASVMLHEARRLRHLVDEVLDLQRIAVGQEPLTLVPIALEPLIANAVRLHQGESERHTLVTAVPRDLPAVPGDARRLRQMIGNLVSNALKYSPDGGEIRIAVTQEDQRLHLTVQDEGLGIPLQALGRLFDRFYRVTDAPHMRVQGTGLGLALVQEIVGIHDGKVWAESAGVGRGSTFHVTLPVASAPVPEVATQPASADWEPVAAS